MRILICTFYLLPLSLFAAEIVDTKKEIKYHQDEADWGIAIGTRTATIAFINAEDDTVSDFVPKMYYEGEYLFLRGETGGLKLWKTENHQVSLLGRYRYFDIPELYQKDYHGTNIDTGVQLEYQGRITLCMIFIQKVLPP